MLIVIGFITLLLMIISYYKYGFLTNPFILEAYYVFLFLIIPQIVIIFIGLGEDYYLSDWVIIIYVISVFLGTQINPKAIKVTEIKYGKNVGVLCTLIAVLLILPSLPILINCGLSIGGIRCYYETVVFTKYAGLYELGKTFLMLALMLFLIKYQKFKWWLIVIIFVIVFSGNKFAIFNLLIFFSIYFELYKKISVTKIFIFIIPVILLLVVYHFLQSKYAENAFLGAITYFDIYEKQSFLLKKFQSGRHDLYYGEIAFSSYYKFIPRILWESKPYNYGFAILNYDFLPEEASANYMPSFGLGTAYADFGMIGVALSGLMAGFIRKYCYKILVSSNINNSSFILYYFSISLFTLQYTLILILLSLIFTPTKQSEQIIH